MNDCLILFGDTRSHANLRILKEHGWGRMFATTRPSPFEGERTGFDNGAFDAWRHGKQFPADLFKRRLDAAIQIITPGVAVVPDKVAAGVESLDFSWSWMAGRDLPDDWPWYSLDSNFPLWTKERTATFVAAYFDNRQIALPSLL